MSALHAQYLTEIIDAHRKGLRVLSELIDQETNPAERRRLAIALIRARPIQDPQPAEEPPAVPTPRSPAKGGTSPSAVPKTSMQPSTTGAPTQAHPPVATTTQADLQVPYTDEYGALILKHGEDEAARLNDHREALIAHATHQAQPPPHRT